jgi:hypothetical protein
MDKTKDFQPIFERLKLILEEYAPGLQVKEDSPGSYSLDTQFSQKYGKDIFFGAVKIQKNYVSYHLMPVYMFPDLLKDISPGLKKHMQGKSCFNFKAIDEAMLTELTNLTRQSIARIKSEHVIE